MAPGGRRRKVRFASGFRWSPSTRFLAPPFPSKPASLGFAGDPNFRWAAEKGPHYAVGTSPRGPVRVCRHRDRNSPTRGFSSSLW